MTRQYKPEFFEQHDIDSHYHRIAKLLSLGVFNVSNFSDLAESAFTEIILRSNDLLQILNKYEERLTFKDDILNEKDITTLINDIRGALSHPTTSHESYLRDKHSVKGTFNRISGRGSLGVINGFVMDCAYPDETAFFYGENRVYLKRHLVRLITEAYSITNEWKNLPEASSRP